MKPIAHVLCLACILPACGGPTSGSRTTPAASSATATAGEPARGSVYPPTARQAVVDAYFGTKVTDDYRWLEDAKDPNVAAWTDTQNKFSRARLDALADRPKIRARIAELLGSQPPSYGTVVVKGGRNVVFALKEQPPKQQPMLVVLGDPDKAATERVVLDPNALDPSGKTAIDFFVPSRDAKRVAVSLSSGGSESGDVHLYDVATGKALPDVVARVNGGTAGGSVAWNADGTGFFYTRYPRDGERPKEDLDFYQQVYFHKLGAPPSADSYVLGKDFPRIAEIVLAGSDDGKSILVSVANGDGGEFAFYVGDEKGAFTQLSRFEDKIIAGSFGHDGDLYLLSRKGAPKGAILRWKKPFATAKPEPLVPEGDGVISAFAATKSRLFVSEIVGGPSRLRAFKLANGKADQPETIEVPYKVPAVKGVERIGPDDILYLAQSYTNAPGWLRYTSSTKKSAPTALVQPMPFPMDDVEVVRESCTSKDGTQVPLNVLRKRGVQLDGSHPALLNAYGGYGVSRAPVLRPMNRLWLDQGGVFAEANLRGGGEFGEAWHDAGKLANKQNVFDDFYACAKTLVEKGYTKPERLGIIGGSNGGLLMGAELVQHPEQYRAVVSMVGIYDMLRVELTPNGAFNVTEFGTVRDEKLFRALLSYSPYHNVKNGVAYPAVLFTTGANDPRVDPYNSRKMTARLQAATSSDRPILLRASADVGHGIGTPLAAEIEEDADIYGFLMNELGMRFAPPAPSSM
jgi:prolyl oligopeptidase